jgi:hypothetical protein
LNANSFRIALKPIHTIIVKNYFYYFAYDFTYAAFSGYQIIQHQEEDRSPLLAEELPDMKTTQR